VERDRELPTTAGGANIQYATTAHAKTPFQNTHSICGGLEGSSSVGSENDADAEGRMTPRGYSFLLVLWACNAAVQRSAYSKRKVSLTCAVEQEANPWPRTVVEASLA